MNLFSKKIAMGTLLMLSATFMMSFDQKSEDYGQSIKVYSNNQINTDEQKTAITAAVRAAAQFTVGVTRNAVRHLTPEMDQMSAYLFGVVNNEMTTVEMKNEKLYNLDK